MKSETKVQIGSAIMQVDEGLCSSLPIYIYIS